MKNVKERLMTGCWMLDADGARERINKLLLSDGAVS